MKQKKLAVINDLSGYGRCSLTVSLPIISAMKVQCCPVPTAILSSHTGFSHSYLDDYTDRMPEYISHWKRLGLTFDGIYTGYLGSKKQIQIVIDFFESFKKTDTVTIIDPVMGDHGKTYQNFNSDICQAMKGLIHYACVLTPNITEACILTNTPYKEYGWKREELQGMADKLHEQGPEQIVITGIRQKGFIANFLSEGIEGREKKGIFLKTKYAGEERPGTGDIFTSIIAADVVRGIPLSDSIKKAGIFIKKCIIRSAELDIPRQDGVCLEEFLTTLR